MTEAPSPPCPLCGEPTTTRHCTNCDWLHCTKCAIRYSPATGNHVSITKKRP